MLFVLDVGNTNNVLGTGSSAGPLGGDTGGNFLRLLPYMEQKALYDQYNFTYAINTGNNTSLGSQNQSYPVTDARHWLNYTAVSSFLCPSVSSMRKSSQ